MSLDYIFGKGVSRRLDFSKLNFQYSRRTGRIRQVVDTSSKGVLFSFRPNGTIVPTVLGFANLLPDIQKLKKIQTRPRWTITVINGVSDEVKKGKTVFCKHVFCCSNDLRSGEDVAILNEDGVLLAAGRSVLAGPFMKQFKRGPAVKIREGAG